MPHVEEKLTYEPLPFYPHLGDQDAVIWDAFVKKNPGKFLNVFYDYRVGESGDIFGETTSHAAAAWHDLTRWRIDVVAETAEKIFIIEVKPHANAKALGQAAAYAALFIEDTQPEKEVVPVVLTDEIIKTTARAAKWLDVELWIP